MFSYTQNKETGIGVLEIDGVVITNIIGVAISSVTNTHDVNYPMLIAEHFVDNRIEIIQLKDGVKTSRLKFVDDLDRVR